MLVVYLLMPAHPSFPFRFELSFFSPFLYDTNFLFSSKEPSKQPPGRPKEGPKEPAWKKEVREAREKKQHTEPDKVCMMN